MVQYDYDDGNDGIGKPKGVTATGMVAKKPAPKKSSQIEVIVEQMYDEIISTWAYKNVIDFFKCKQTDLVGYHASLGKHIRNKYNFWGIPWEPEMKMVMGVECDCSPFHPDAVSSTVINMIWSRGLPKN